MRREEGPGPGEGPQGVGKTGGVLITGGGVLITGRGGRGGGQRRKVGKGAPGLTDVGSAGTGGNLVVDRTTIRA